VSIAGTIELAGDAADVCCCPPAFTGTGRTVTLGVAALGAAGAAGLDAALSEGVKEGADLPAAPKFKNNEAGSPPVLDPILIIF